MNYTIDKCSTRHYQQLIEVWEQSVRASHHFLKEEDLQFYKPLILNNYFPILQLYCVRNDEHQIIGFLAAHEQKIEMLFVKPEYFGKGVGSALINFALHHLNLTEVDVNEVNEKARHFYQKYGFRMIGRAEVDGAGKPYPILFMKLEK